jgi:hypothetical protein
VAIRPFKATILAAVKRLGKGLIATFVRAICSMERGSAIDLVEKALVYPKTEMVLIPMQW